MGAGTTGIGQEEERNEGSREDTKSESDGREGELGVSIDEGGAEGAG